VKLDLGAVLRVQERNSLAGNLAESLKNRLEISEEKIALNLTTLQKLLNSRSELDGSDGCERLCATVVLMTAVVTLRTVGILRMAVSLTLGNAGMARVALVRLPVGEGETGLPKSHKLTNVQEKHRTLVSKALRNGKIATASVHGLGIDADNFRIPTQVEVVGGNEVANRNRAGAVEINLITMLARRRTATLTARTLARQTAS